MKTKEDNILYDKYTHTQIPNILYDRYKHKNSGQLFVEKLQLRVYCLLNDNLKKATPFLNPFLMH